MNERLPSEKMVLKLLSESGCSRRVINHCIAVEKVATEIAKACKKRGLNVNVKLVQVGALLHDIGRSKTHSVDHAIVGAEIARSLNLPEAIVSIIERHVGGGITVEEAKNLGWPVKSYIPETLEEKIVSYADKLIEGSERVSIEETIKRFSKKLPPSSIAGMRKLHEEITLLTGAFDADSHIA